MTWIADLAMYGWIPAVVVLYSVLPSRRATIVSFVASWLFLPVRTIEIYGFPDYTKIVAGGLGALAGTLLFDSSRFRAFRPRWFDVPMGMYCVAPFMASVSNGLGPYDGMSEAMEVALEFGLPYFIGRIYFTDLESLKELAVGIFVGGVVYVPLCLYEIRMSPTLHDQIYGYQQTAFEKGIRYGGYRPIVFMWDFIGLAAWMSMALVAGFWLWFRGRVREVWSIPMPFLLGGLGMTVLLGKTMTSFILIPIGLAVPWVVMKLKRGTPLVFFLLFITSFMGIRAVGLWDAQELVDLAYAVDEERGFSLEVRITNENALSERAMHRPLFGWGGWRRSRVFDDFGKDTSTQDGRWIIVFGKTGFLGLFGLILTTIVPLVRFVRRYPPAVWGHPQVIPAIVLVAATLMAYVNNIPNTTIDPIMTVALGALIGLPGVRLARPARASAPPGG